MDRQTLAELFKATAAIDTPEGMEAYKAFAQALTVPILQEIKDASIMRQLFAVERLAPGAQAVYPVADDFDVPVFVLPGLGYIAQNFVEGVGEEVFVPTFSISVSADWKVTYARDSRIDIPERAARNAARAIADYEEDSGWRVIVPGGTTDFAGQGLLGARNAPVSQVPAGSTGEKFLSKELINLMLVAFKRVRRSMTDLYISPEDAADIREWTDTQIDPVTRREIFTASGLGRIWNINLHEVFQLGGTGRFNINQNGATFGVFQVDGSGDFNDYTPTNVNTVDANGNVTTAGETQVWGFDLSVNDSLVMPVRKEYEAHDDPTLLRQQKQGFFGWEEVGFALLDSRMVGMGVIDRS
jgi:hypothetical protein